MTMNRHERRRLNLEYKKDTNIINSLSPTQANLIDKVTEQKSLERGNRYIENFQKLYDRNMCAALIDYNIEFTEIEEIQKNMDELLLEDSIKSSKLEKECINVEKLQNDVQIATEELLKKGISKKQIIDQLMCKFPKLSKSLLLNAYAKIKKELGLTENRTSQKDVYEEFEQHSGTYNSQQSIEHLMNKFDFTKTTATTYYYNWKKQFMGSNKKMSNEKVKILEKEIKKVVNIPVKNMKIEDLGQASIIKKVEVKDMSSNLKVIEEKVVKTVKVQGQNGKYEAITEKGVDLTIREGVIIHFRNIDELVQWTEEIKQVFALVV